MTTPATTPTLLTPPDSTMFSHPDPDDLQGHDIEHDKGVEVGNRRVVRRYPSNLSSGRPYTRRRGTSTTYETFEDLLRDAGYKDTRVFTPETDRKHSTQHEGDQHPQTETPQKGYIASLFSNWITGSASGSHDSRKSESAARKALDSNIRRLPPSPLAKRSLTAVDANLLRVDARSEHSTHRPSGSKTPKSPSGSRSRAQLRHAQSSPHIQRRLPNRGAPRSTIPNTWLAPGPVRRANSAQDMSASRRTRATPRLLLQRASSSAASVVVVSQTSVVCRSTSPTSPTTTSATGQRGPSLLSPKSVDPFWGGLPLEVSVKRADTWSPGTSPPIAVALKGRAQDWRQLAHSHRQHSLGRGRRAITRPSLQYDDQENDNDEPSLVNLLEGPAKRQRSIRSLRECLGKNVRRKVDTPPVPPLPLRYGGRDASSAAGATRAQSIVGAPQNVNAARSLASQVKGEAEEDDDMRYHTFGWQTASLGSNGSGSGSGSGRR